MSKTFEQFWNALVLRNPRLRADAADTLSITVGNFRKALEQAYQQGELHERDLMETGGADIEELHELFGLTGR